MLAFPRFGCVFPVLGILRYCVYLPPMFQVNSTTLRRLLRTHLLLCASLYYFTANIINIIGIVNTVNILLIRLYLVLCSFGVLEFWSDVQGSRGP